MSDRLDRYLLLWVAWVKAHRLRLGYPQHSSGMATGGSVQSFEDMVHDADSYAARTVDGLIQNLSVKEGRAIGYYHLGENWPELPMVREFAYQEARAKIEQGLNRWGLV